MLASMYVSLFSFCIFLFAQLSCAAVIEYDWRIGWKTANPDGLQPRPIIAVNKQWPPPIIRGNVNDTVLVNVHNDLGNQSLSIHWHGIHMTGNNANDGVPMISQCPILPGSSYTYKIYLNQSGTYWWHSHSEDQYVDGIRGPLIVDDSSSPYAGQYDEEVLITVSDWYHEQGAVIQPDYLSIPMNPKGLEPIPVSALMNDQLWPGFVVQPNKTYLLRILNIAGYAQFYFHIDSHNMTIVEADGVYTEPQLVQDLYIATGQRYNVLVQTKPTKDQNYGILAAMDLQGFPQSALNITPPINPNVTGMLIYDPFLPLPNTPSVQEFITFDDWCLVPFDEMPLLAGEPDIRITLNLSVFSQIVPLNEQNRAGYNNITYIAQKVPSLYTVLSGGEYALNPIVYGHHSDAYVIGPNNIVELIVYNYDTGLHPIHLHGHSVQLVSRTGSACNDRLIPMRRDTWMEPRWNSSDPIHPNTTVRFRADNPGVWFFHCHMEWHLIAGMNMVLVEDPLAIQREQPDIPAEMSEICKKQQIPLKGNAAGNYDDFLDLTGEVNVAPLECGADYPPNGPPCVNTGKGD